MNFLENMFSRKKNTNQPERSARAVSPSRLKRLREESPTGRSMEWRQNNNAYRTANKDYSRIMKRKIEQLQQEEEEREKKEEERKKKEQLLQREEERKKNYEYWNKQLPQEVKSMYGPNFGGRILKNNNKKPKKVSEKVKKPKKISEKVKKPKKISEKVKKPKKISEKVKKPKKVSEKVKKPKKVF